MKNPTEMMGFVSNLKPPQGGSSLLFINYGVVGEKQGSYQGPGFSRAGKRLKRLGL